MGTPSGGQPGWFDDIAKHDKRLKNLEKRLEKSEKVQTITNHEIAEVQQQLAEMVPRFDRFTL
jgi:uncharacterized coiled-coil protein SlyX